MLAGSDGSRHNIDAVQAGEIKWREAERLKAMVQTRGDYFVDPKWIEILCAVEVSII